MTPQEEIDLLLRVVTRLAQKQLEKGGFISTRDEVETYWYAELRKHVAADGCNGACFCADVKVPLDAGGYASAIYVYIEHPQAEAANIFYPYSQDPESHVEFGPPTTVKTEHHVFLRPQNPTPGTA